MTQIDGTSPIDSAVFTIDYTVNPMTISVYTTDFSKAATYNMRVKVEDAKYSTVFATKDFTIVVVNPCLADTLSVSSSKFASPALTYNVKSTAGVLSWTNDNVSSSKSL